MPTRSCAASCRESPTRLSTASKWFSPNWPTSSPRQRPPTQETLSTLDFSKSSIVPAISMDFTVKTQFYNIRVNSQRIPFDVFQHGLQELRRRWRAIIFVFLRLVHRRCRYPRQYCRNFRVFQHIEHFSQTDNRGPRGFARRLFTDSHVRDWRRQIGRTHV